MKRFVLTFVALAMFLCLNAQTSEYAPQMSTSTIYNKDAKFLLFPTKNMYIFL